MLLLGLAAFAAGDPPLPKNQPAPKDQTTREGASDAKRLLYIVKHGTAKDLASVLGQHFKGVAEIQALPDPSNNCLLISAAPSAFDEVVQVLEKLDRRPQTVSVEILIAQVAMKKADDDKTAPAEEVDEKEFTGTISDVEAKVMGLQKKGVFTDVKRIQFTAVEGRPQSVLLGESEPYVTAVNITANGRVSRNLMYRDAGTAGQGNGTRFAGESGDDGPQSARVASLYTRRGHLPRQGRERQADPGHRVRRVQPDQQAGHPVGQGAGRAGRENRRQIGQGADDRRRRGDRGGTGREAGEMTARTRDPGTPPAHRAKERRRQPFDQGPRRLFFRKDEQWNLESTSDESGPSALADGLPFPSSHAPAAKTDGASLAA